MDTRVNKFIMVLAMIMLFAVNSYAIFGIEKILPDLNLFKQEVKGDMNGIRADFNGKMTGIESKVDSVIDMQVKIQTDLKANASAIAGFNNKIEQVNTSISAGRDVSQNSGNTTTNDTGLMQTIFRYWYGIFVIIIGFMKWNSWQTIKIFKAQIKDIELEKKFYKDMYIAESIKDDSELAKMREAQDRFIKSGGKHL